MVVSAGKRDQYILIERPQRAANSFGEAAITGWAVIDQQWAQALTERALEIVAGKRDASEIIVAFIMSDAALIAPGDRINWDGVFYGVAAVQPPRRTGEIVVTARMISGGDGR